MKTKYGMIWARKYIITKDGELTDKEFDTAQEAQDFINSLEINKRIKKPILK